jgi:sec-independent protein translocase protein TatA
MNGSGWVYPGGRQGEENTLAGILAVPTLGWPELLLILAVLLLLFGARKLPDMARSMGRSTKEFKAGLKEGVDEPSPPEGSETVEPTTKPGPSGRT